MLYELYEGKCNKTNRVSMGTICWKRASRTCATNAGKGVIAELASRKNSEREQMQPYNLG